MQFFLFIMEFGRILDKIFAFRTKIVFFSQCVPRSVKCIRRHAQIIGKSPKLFFKEFFRNYNCFTDNTINGLDKRHIVSTIESKDNSKPLVYFATNHENHHVHTNQTCKLQKTAKNDLLGLFQTYINQFLVGLNHPWFEVLV